MTSLDSPLPNILEGDEAVLWLSMAPVAVLGQKIWICAIQNDYSPSIAVSTILGQEEVELSLS